MLLTQTNIPLYSDMLTQTMISVSPVTPVPTLTGDEIAQLQLRWQHDLEAAVGFSHPVLETIAGYFVGSLQGRTYTLHDWNTYTPEPEVSRVTFENVLYVAVVNRDTLLTPVGWFLMFRMIDDQPELLDDELPNYPRADFMYLNVFTTSDGQIISGFADRNGNGYPDLAVDTASSGSNGWSITLLFELRPAGEVVYLTPATPDVPPNSFVDLNGDSILEMRGVWKYYDVALGLPNCCFPLMIRYFGWDGTVYQDISSTLPDLYYPAIAELQKGFRGGFGCMHPSVSLYQMLIDYYAIGRLPEGWAWLQPRLDLNSCSIHDTFNYEIDGLLKWVNVRLAEETRQMTQG
ncbi:MAG: hypothetical protein U0694_16765 [Anaerolineae bacterium]